MAKSPNIAFLATANSLCMNVKVVNVSSYEGAPDAFSRDNTDLWWEDAVPTGVHDGTLNCVEWTQVVVPSLDACFHPCPTQ